MRSQGFEFHDLAWFPQSWRRLLTSFTGGFARVFGIYDPFAGRLFEAVRQSRADVIIDLCAGSDSPLVGLCRRASREGVACPRVVLTDKFPPPDANRRNVAATGESVSYLSESVDAVAVPEALEGFRTIFSAFHHFPPPAAQGILLDAVRNRAGIGVFEYTERSLTWVFAVLAIPLFVWFTAPFLVRPFRLRDLLWLYLFPPLLLTMIWDGLVSCLRTYNPKQLASLVRGLDASGYRWDIGRVRVFGGCRVTYLIGVPALDGDGEAEADRLPPLPGD